MSFPIEDKLVIAVSSSALFDLKESDDVFTSKGEKEYHSYQHENIDNPFKKGAAFSFIRRFLTLNDLFPDEAPVEVILLSRNSPTSGLRVFRSIEHYGLDICRAVFLKGKSPNKYIKSFNASLFLSANNEDVVDAIKSGYPAGTVMSPEIDDNEEDHELRIAFDFDGVLVDDESESVFANNNLESFEAHEIKHSKKPHGPGPLKQFFEKITAIQDLENKRFEEDNQYKRFLRTSIVTTRSAPAHERAINTLLDWGVSPDDAFFMGGVRKSRVLKELKPHMFFDDQKRHLEDDISEVSMVHIPFGVNNV